MLQRLKPRCGQIAPGIFRTRWSPRILSIFDGSRRKDIVYIGFPDKAAADKFYTKVLNRRPDWKYQSFPLQPGQSERDGAGVTKPRKSERLTEYPVEVKWHRPPLEFIEGLIRFDCGECVAGMELTERAYKTFDC